MIKKVTKFKRDGHKERENKVCHFEKKWHNETETPSHGKQFGQQLYDRLEIDHVFFSSKKNVQL